MHAYMYVLYTCTCTCIVTMVCHIAVYSNLSNCSHGDVRIAGGESKYDGRVEVCINGVWNSVCSQLWGNLHAQVVCRQLNHSSLGVSSLKTFTCRPSLNSHLLFLLFFLLSHQEQWPLLIFLQGLGQSIPMDLTAKEVSSFCSTALTPTALAQPRKRLESSVRVSVTLSLCCADCL